MKLKTDQFKKLCATVLSAIDTGNKTQEITGILALESRDGYLYLNITNNEYYLSARFLPIEYEEIHASVKAALFLKLIADLDSEEIELKAFDTYISVNTKTGKYKVPYIFNNKELVKVTPIKIFNPMTTMAVDGDIWNSILLFNSKELVKTIWQKGELQKLFYIDQQGCITFTNGACVNNFMLPEPVRFLVGAKIVKLFRLFKGNTTKFTIGYDPAANNLIQTKITIETDDIVLTAITALNESVLLAKAGEDYVRGLANKVSPYSAVIEVAAFKKAVDRLLLFIPKEEQMKATAIFTCTADEISILGNGENTDIVKLEQGSMIDGEYKMKVGLFDLKLVLDSCAEQTITMNFGDRRMIVLTRQNIKNLLPEDSTFNG